MASPSRTSLLACSRHQRPQTRDQAVCYLVMTSCVSCHLLQKYEPRVIWAKVDRAIFREQDSLVCSRLKRELQQSN